MPRIELITEVLYNPNDPIHWEVDNLPLKAILARQNLINLSLDNVIDQIRDAIGDQGSVANRLNQSLNADGSLKTAAVDEALHSIEEHADTDDFVRMTKDESDKLELIADEATDVAMEIYTDPEDLSTKIEWDSGVIKIQPSSTVVPYFESPNILKFNLTFPNESIHQHYYGLTPVHDNITTPDYINYKINNTASPEFVEGSLRVMVNGFRIFEDAEIYVPGALVDDPWMLLSYTPDHENGTFELSAAISEDDVIRIDFDIPLV